MHVPQDPDIPYASMETQETLEYTQQHILTAAQTQKQPKCPSKQNRKLWYRYTMKHCIEMKMDKPHLFISTHQCIKNIMYHKRVQCSIVQN